MCHYMCAFYPLCVCQLCLSIHVADKPGEASKYSVSGMALVICLCIGLYAAVFDIGLRVNQINMKVHIWLLYMYM